MQVMIDTPLFYQEYVRRNMNELTWHIDRFFKIQVLVNIRRLLTLLLLLLRLILLVLLPGYEHICNQDYVGSQRCQCASKRGIA